MKKEGLKYGIIDKGELVRFIIADFMARYDEKRGLIATVKAVEMPEKLNSRESIKNSRVYRIAFPVLLEISR